MRLQDRQQTQRCMRIVTRSKQTRKADALLRAVPCGPWLSMDFRATKPRAPRDAKPHLAEKAKPAGSGKAGTRKAPLKVGKSKALSQAQKAIAKPRTKAPTKGKRDADKLKTRGAKVKHLLEEYES